MDEKKIHNCQKKKTESKITLFIITDSNEKILTNYHTDIICVLKYFRMKNCSHYYAFMMSDLNHTKSD